MDFIFSHLWEETAGKHNSLSFVMVYLPQHTSYMRWLQYGVCFLVQVILVSCDRNTKERIGKGI